MTSEEVKELLPLYLTNKLTPDERRSVEEALQSSQELKKVLRNLKHIQHAVLLEEKYATENHPTSEEIVFYAERQGLDPTRRLEIGKHIQACNDCCEELNMILKTFPEPEPSPLRKIAQRFAEVSSQLATIATRPAFAIPAVVVAALCVFLLTRPPHGINTTIRVLEYEETYRGPEAGPLPNLTFSADTTQAKIMLLLFHNPTLPRYVIRITSPSGVSTTLPDTVLSGRYNDRRDSTSVGLDQSLFGVGGVYTFTALPLSSENQTVGRPFEFKIRVEKRH